MDTMTNDIDKNFGCNDLPFSTLSNIFLVRTFVCVHAIDALLTQLHLHRNRRGRHGIT